MLWCTSLRNHDVTMSNERNENESLKRRRDVPVDFVVVFGECGYFRVSRRTAARIATVLDKRWRTDRS